MKTFKSKVGYGLLIPILILMAGVTLLPAINGAPKEVTLLMILIMIPISGFVLKVFLGTTYQIDGRQHLLIRCGIFYNKSLKVSEITSIRRTRSPISAPAASLDRIELKYGKWDSVIISPSDKIGFVNELTKINPDIQHDLR